MELDLFAGTPVGEFARSLEWYQRLLGAEPSFFPHQTEAVWELGEHRYLYIVEQPDRSGRAVHLLFVDDLDDRIERLHAAGIRPMSEEVYGSGVRKVVYRDPDGNEIGFGGGAAQ